MLDSSKLYDSCGNLMNKTAFERVWPYTCIGVWTVCNKENTYRQL